MSGIPKWVRPTDDELAAAISFVWGERFAPVTQGDGLAFVNEAGGGFGEDDYCVFTKPWCIYDRLAVLLRDNDVTVTPKYVEDAAQ